MDQRLLPPFFDLAGTREALGAIWRKHGEANSALREDLLAYLKGLVQTAHRAAEAGLEADGNGRRCAAALSSFQDELIRLIYDFAVAYVHRSSNPSSSERMAVVATGGYGRGLMAPYSDVDLLFLLPYKQTPWGESIVEYILYLLWDLGFKVGHATRSVEQTIRFAKSDVLTQTALLDARFILGEDSLWQKFKSQFRDQIISGGHREFIAAKLEERDKRHERTGASRYRVEPNIKDGKGGLRDLHTLYWIAKHLHPDLNGENFVAAGIFTKSEYSLYRHCEDFLWTVRCHLHFLSGKPEERLTFDVQQQMADRLHYRGRSGMMGVERFMKHYFLIAKDVGDLTRILCSSLEVQQLKGIRQFNSLLQPLSWSARARLSATSDFRIENGRIAVKSRDVFKNDPVNLIRIFAVAERSDVQFHPEALRLVRHSLRLIDDNLRNDPEANRLFLEILTSRTRPELTLRRMNEAGVLGRFIPDFGRVVSMMQFNMYHHFTVDEHLIRSVGVLAAIERGALEHELPLSTEIIRNVENRRALYVATFLHDVAKGRCLDHSLAGAQVARDLGPRLGLRPDETATVAWLIEHHLVMSQFAQSRDLYDAKTIRDFANIVQSREMLMLLVILTAADIRAVGPGVWTGWKGQLLRQLYYETEPLLTGGHTGTPRETRIRTAIADFRKAMAGRPEEEIEAFIARQIPAYWVRSDVAHQLMHANLIRRAEDERLGLAYEITTDSFTSLTELNLWTADRPGLIAAIAGACAAAKSNIVGAFLSTTRDGMALNSFQLQRQFPDDREEMEFAARIAANIELALKGKRDLRKIISQRIRPRPRLEAFSVEPRISIDNSLSDELTVIEVNGRDRTGLLFDLARILGSLNIDISSAHIATFGEKAVDVFYVTDSTRKKITREAVHKQLREKLLEAFETDGELVSTDMES
ncbi:MULTISPECIES: [protein-PII] uridylyltransferase [Rhodomicrobium]|uniref:[protein-PII] uridylyltransferase n=1 Tax=Rhodomicrobium TaxID=1068 RepID=UPI000B4AF698|nr:MULTISPECIES: [protein-PII] uridylyltransferase [Rhodomicrobium]